MQERMMERDMLRRRFLEVAGASVAAATAPAVLAQKSGTGPVLAPAPFVLSGTDMDGKTLTLKQYLGKACLISFFTADCVLCENDLRLMREFFGANKQRNYVNLGVNMDTDPAALAEYVRLIRLTIPVVQHFPILWRNAKTHSDNFGPITSEPTHFVLDKEHKLVVRRNGKFRPQDWDDLWTNLD